MSEFPRSARDRAGSPGRRTLWYAVGGASLAGVLAVGAAAILFATGAFAGADMPATAPDAGGNRDASQSEESSGAGDSAAPSAPATGLPVADPAWVTRMSAASGVPERALSAYAMAELTLVQEQPGCRLGWNMLAGIGTVESDHGRINGSRMLADGTTTPRIIGVPLDGTKFLATPDTDGGAIDGDPEWDRAVGPMQFIPSTWAMFGRDGNGDGRIDIDQIDDAALSAATLLCDPGLDLTVGENWIAALDGYNPSASYNNDVADAAEFYAQLGSG
ncbi:lytic transglycosylase domain-containing protein [Leucobacter japonicus]|uniref:lytic transglycosylase domain-containing protein n=1 Tax=Leucobacter japonicus TaxID=1461259 RepID=UPI000A7BCF6D|nr:lytic murein transglycosylase [Leucobacter japonicus]